MGPEQRNSRSPAEEAAADRRDPVGPSTAHAAEASPPVDPQPRQASPRLAEDAEQPGAVGGGSADVGHDGVARTTTLADSPRWVSGADSQKPVRGAPAATPAGNKASASAAATPMSATSRALLVKRPGAYFAVAPMPATASGSGGERPSTAPRDRSHGMRAGL